jgi:hypothetical protein
MMFGKQGEDENARFARIAPSGCLPPPVKRVEGGESTVAIFTGTSGDNVFTAASGNNRYDGLGGNDTISFNFNLTDATVTYSGTQVIIDAPGYHTILTGFQTYQFNDGTVDENDGNPLVADLYYYSRYHDVWLAHADADAHYSSFGWHEGRDPSAFFSTNFYLALNQSVKASGFNPLTQFDTTGWKAGAQPSPNFDVQAYRSQNPDVAAAGVDPLAHFLQYGGDEGRQPTAVSSILVGTTGFDAAYYLAHNPDVLASAVDPLQHFLDFGWKEGRDPNGYFDTKGYLANNPDVAAAGVNPFLHYNQFGWKEGRDPSPWFDTSAYLDANPDVKAAGVNPLVHFLENGIKEGRAATPLVLADTDGTTNQIAAGASAGTLVHLTASWGDWKTTSYSIVSDTSDGGFTINSQTGAVTVANSSKVAADATHSVTVRAFDDGHEVTKSFDIVVGTGVANAAPTAAGLNNQVPSVAENGGDIKVADIVIVDDGQGTNNITLSGADAASFAIVNGGSGPELHFLGGADFETKSSYGVTVEIDDPTIGPTPDASQSFTLNITDVNEAPTAVSLDNQVTSTAENGVAIKVADIAVTDDALGTETLSLSGADAGSFSILNGNELWFNGSANFEAQSSYSVTVQADDTTVGATPDASQNFTLTITDVNDAPVITSGSSATTPEHVSTATVVFDIDATDDGENSGTLTYSLTGTDASKFNIDPATGEVTFAASPDVNAPDDDDGDNVYDIIVHANDGSLDTQKSVSITVTPVAAPLLDLDTGDGDFTADSGQPASFTTSYTSGGVPIPVAGAVAISDDHDAIDSLVVHLTAAGGSALNSGEVLSLAGSYPGFTVSFDDSNPFDYVLTITAASPQTAATFADIIQNISYSNPTTDFSFVAEDRAISFTLTDNDGLDTSGQAFLPVTHVEIAADVSDATGIDGFTGSSHADTIFGNGGDDTINAGAGADIVDGGIGDDSLYGGDGDDQLTGGIGDDSIDGGAGDDTIYHAFGDGSDSVDGGADTDTYVYTATDAVSLGLAAGDGVTVNDGADSVTLNNVELVKINLGADGDSVTLSGDLSLSGVTSVTVDAGDGANTIDASGVTSSTPLTLTTGADGDSIIGGAGNDRITGGGGDDDLTGGLGSDTFVFAATFGSDTIADFVTGVDHIELHGFSADDVTITPSGGDSIIDVDIGPTHFGTISITGVVVIEDLIFL